jgi:hypothetical protein
MFAATKGSGKRGADPQRAVSATLHACPGQPDEFLAGAFASKGDGTHDPALKFLHGTTTLGFVFSKGIIISVDSRASMGSYVGDHPTPAGCGSTWQCADARVRPVQARRL